MMRYTQAEKMEIIRLVEESELPVKHTLDELGVAKSSFYRWYRRYEQEGYEGLSNRSPTARRFWNKIPEDEKAGVVETALERPEMSPRELAWHITDTQGTFISESSVYRILKSYDLITSPAYIVMEAADEFRHKTKGVHELWQTDFTYMKIIGWGWYYLSTILDDFSRYIIAWRLQMSKTRLIWLFKRVVLILSRSDTGLACSQIMALVTWRRIYRTTLRKGKWNILGVDPITR